MASESVTLDHDAIGLTLCHARAIADLMGAAGSADLRPGTLTDAAHALCTLLDKVSQEVSHPRAPWADHQGGRA